MSTPECPVDSTLTVSLSTARLTTALISFQSVCPLKQVGTELLINDATTLFV